MTCGFDLFWKADIFELPVSILDKVEEYILVYHISSHRDFLDLFP